MSQQSANPEPGPFSFGDFAGDVLTAAKDVFVAREAAKQPVYQVTSTPDPTQQVGATPASPGAGSNFTNPQPFPGAQWINTSAQAMPFYYVAGGLAVGLVVLLAMRGRK